MARMKMVNGAEVPLSAEEETARNAEELAWANRPPPAPPPPSDETVTRALLIDKGLITAADWDAKKTALTK